MSCLGTDFKINVHVEPIDGLHMDDYDFTCRFSVYTNRVVQVEKKDMIRVDQDNYVACIDSRKIGSGGVKMRFTAFIPDVDFPDGLRTEVETIYTGITIG